jgi:hypothetical protein
LKITGGLNYPAPTSQLKAPQKHRAKAIDLGIDGNFMKLAALARKKEKLSAIITVQKDPVTKSAGEYLAGSVSKLEHP